MSPSAYRRGMADESRLAKAAERRIERAWERLEKHESKCKACNRALPWESCPKVRPLEAELKTALAFDQDTDPRPGRALAAAARR